MATMKAIKRRIVSVKNLKQIMKAMNLVATSKLQKARSRLDLIRPMYNDIKLVMDRLSASKDTELNIFVEKREVKNIACLVITSDRGLCGPYNINVLKQTMSFINDTAKDGKKENILVIGNKGWDFLRRRGKNIIQKYSQASDDSFYKDARCIGEKLIDLYTSGEADEVYVIYTQYITLMSHEPKVVKLLPFGARESDEDHSDDRELMEYDPDISSFMSKAVPMYISMSVYGAMVESVLCELASKMMSMDSAARNATEIIDKLTLEKNRKRQGMITQEITEIVSGANALQ